MAVQRYDTFASLLKRHRNAAGLTQEELAGRAGIGARTISNLERGINKAPYPSTVRRLADALGLSGEVRTKLAASARSPVEQPSRGQRTAIKGGFLGAMPTARLVARGKELGKIVDAAEVTEGGSGRLVLLAGEPGIGKTRLAQEASVHAWKRRFVVACGRCYDAQSGVPFYPFLDALSTLYEEAPPAISNAIPERWPYLARLLPDQFPSRHLAFSESQEESQRLLRAVTGFVRDVCAERPVALLLDDLHCADGASLDLLAYLSRHTRGDRMLLVGTYRDVEVGRGHPLRRAVRVLESEQLVEKVVLGRLGPEETAALMCDKLDKAEVSEEFAGLVYGHTEGNPFFTVEVLKTLIERGDLSRWEGHWVRKEIEDLTTPESVSEVISERVSRLQPATQRVLEEASVLGEAFSFEDLMSVVGLGERQAEEALEEAEAYGLVRTTRDRYAFDHALTQQSIYAGLSPARRKRLHNSAGEGLRKLTEKVRHKRAAEISRHFMEGGSPERALPYALLAGDEAAAVFAHGEAELHYRFALDLTEEMGDEHMAAEALEKLGGLLATTVRYDEALSVLERASGIHRARNATEATSRVEARIAQTHFRRGSKDEGVVRLSAYLSSLDKPGALEGARRGMAALYCALARLYWARTQFAESRDAAKRAASLSRELGDARSLADAEMVRGSALLWLDASDEGMEVLAEAAALAERAEALDTLSTALSFLHWAYVLRGEFDRGRECGERGAAVADKAGDTDALALHTSNIGLGLFYLGDWREAQVYLECGAELARSRPPSFFSGIPLACLGTLRLAEGAWEDAARCLSEAFVAHDVQSPEFRGYVQTLLAQLDLLRGRPAEALARLEPYASYLPSIRDAPTLSVLAEAYADTGEAARAEEAVDLALMRADLMRNRVAGLEASRIRAKILTKGGRREEAIVALEEALSGARSMPYPYAEGKILREYGILYIRESKPERARERLSAALGIFVRLGAKKYAEQTGRTLQKLGRS
jgi:tetratricopeptide (TPR) repeat protein/transcriptional regulator with XRE-family HTH domain